VMNSPAVNKKGIGLGNGGGKVNEAQMKGI
jgi:hypothetical protein